MPRRRNKSKSSRPRKPWRIPRVRLAMRWLATPLGLMVAKINAQSMRRLSMGAAWSAAVGLMVVAWMFGVPRLQAFASHERFAGMVHVRFVDPPKWFNGDLAEHLTQTADMSLNGDPMQRADLVACRETLLQTGWFESISQVRRVRNDLVEIDAQFARPYTVVRDADGDHLVDVIGRLLPLKYDPGARTNFISVTGAHFPRPQRCGEVWEGADVIAALRLLSVIDQQPWRSQVTAVDVAGFHDGAPIRLLTDKNTKIIWGGAPGEEPALEVLAEGKLKRLSFMFEKYGRIDAGEIGENREIDITNEKGVLTR